MSDDKKSFTVSDRRHFTAEGKARDEAAEPEPERRDPAPAASASAPSASAPSASAPAASAPAAVADEAGGPADDDLGELPPFPADLLGLVGSLATQASVLLAGDPQGSRPPSAPELEAVRSIIALIDVLHEKTKGNRTPQEDRVLDAVRYELKMAYVAQTRAGGA